MTIEIDFLEISNFLPEDIWVDGDPPKDFTASDVLDALRNTPLTIRVQKPNPFWHGDNTIPGVQAPSPIVVTHARGEVR